MGSVVSLQSTTFYSNPSHFHYSPLCLNSLKYIDIESNGIKKATDNYRGKKVLEVNENISGINVPDRTISMHGL